MQDVLIGQGAIARHLGVSISTVRRATKLNLLSVGCETVGGSNVCYTTQRECSKLKKMGKKQMFAEMRRLEVKKEKEEAV